MARKKRSQPSEGTPGKLETAIAKTVGIKPEKLRKKITKGKKWLIRIAKLVGILLVCNTALWILTPSVEQYYGEEPESNTIASLELPLLEDGEILILHHGYSLVYNERYEQAKWVAYELTKAEVFGTYERGDNFREDLSIASASADLADYSSSGFDRGHLIPAADLKWSMQAMSDSFLMSNMSPQDPAFNRGIWASLEDVVRNFAVTGDSVLVVTGPVLSDGPYRTIGDNQVAVPNQFYKVVLDYSGPEHKAIGFLLPNKKSTQSPAYYATSVDAVEHVTDIDFFPQLPDSEERQLESSFDTAAWDFKPFQASDAERAAYQATLADKPQETAQPPRETKALIKKIMFVKARISAMVLRSTPIPLRRYIDPLF